MNYVDLIGVPYKVDGRDKSGIDCWGIVHEVRERIGRPVEDYAAPGSEALMDELVAREKGLHGWRRIDAPTPFCVVAIRIGRFVSHVGVVLEDCATFIHSRDPIGVVIERLDCPRWANRIEGFYERA